MATITLADGRVLAYEQYGAADGVPVMLFHGGPGSRLICPDAGIARDKGIRLVTVDRPGYGRSDPRPTRTLTEWPADVCALADAIGIGEFGLIGWSAGGSHALACGALLGPRVTRIVLVGAAGPTDEVPGVMESDAARRTVYEGVLRDREATAQAVAEFLAPQVADPLAYVEGMRAGSPDDATWANPIWTGNLTDGVVEGLRQRASGLVGDAVAGLGPWGFSLSDVELPVCIGHGSNDTVVEVHARYLASALPRGELAWWQGHGHGAVYTKWDEILDRV